MSTNRSWTGDPATWSELADELYRLLPTLYRVQDEAPLGQGDLRAFLGVLAGPLAAVQQSIRELHADLFVDTSGEAALPLLAKMVATNLVFPDTDRNRIDVRNTVRWRRRKGTPAMLREMAEDLSGRQAPLVEGWTLCQVAQDLDLRREARVLPDVRPRLLAESATGAWDSAHHLVDARAPTRATGRAHPRHLAWFVHPTRLWPLTGSTACWLGDGMEPLDASGALGLDPDWRYAFHPTGADWPLRLRGNPALPTVRGDRLGEARFAADPGAWFGREGAFLVRVCGLPAAALAEDRPARSGSTTPASTTLAAGAVRTLVLDSSGARMLREVVVSVQVAPLVGLTPDLGAVATAVTRGFTAAGPGAEVQTPITPGATDVVLLRVAPASGGPAWFGGATLAVVSDAPTAAAASPDGALAREGFLEGALVLDLPAGWVTADTLFFVAADGSLYRAHDGTAAIPVTDPTTLPADERVVTGPGPAWPPQAPAASSTPTATPLLAPGCAPTVLHGARVLTDTGSGWAPLTDPAVRCSLVFAVRSAGDGSIEVRPQCRLSWTGGDPSGATWAATDGPTDAVSEADLAARVAAVRAWLTADDPADPTLAVRFEASVAGLRVCPGEVAVPLLEGDVVLAHLPELTTTPTAAGDEFPTDPTLWVEASETLLVAADGSTWPTSGDHRRASAGQIAPLADDVPLLRRVVRGRRLCAWRNETPSSQLAGTAARALDVDVVHGLFAFADRPQAWAPPAGGWSVAPPNVGVDYEDARTDHVGALPEAREPELDLRQPAATRVVSRSGAVPAGHDPATTAFHRSLAAALAAAGPDEVVQLVDSATLVGETLVFPAGGGALTLQASERHRPVVRLAAPTTGATAFTTLTLRGLHFEGAEVRLPPAAAVVLQFCTLGQGARLVLDLGDGGSATLVGCVLGAVEVSGRATVSISRSVLDGSPALLAPEATVELDRTTVRGDTTVFAVEASECIFDGGLTVTDRFQGCVRYSRVPSGARLPRNYRCAVGTTVRYTSTEPTQAAYARLSERCDAAVARGAEDGGEMGAFHDTWWGPILDALTERLRDATPAGLRAGTIRND